MQLRDWLSVTPRQKDPRPCGDERILSGRGPSQLGWYTFVANRVQGLTVLDVGCGSGEGLRVLASHAADALGIDLDARLVRPDVPVQIKGIAQMPDKSFDVVVCMDVVEHVVDDRAFVDQLCRVARRAVFLTTPNYTFSRNRNPYHVREYTPREFERLFDGLGEAQLFAGLARGGEIVPLTRRRAYFLVNELYAWRPTLLLAKVVKRVLRVTMWKHQAVWLELRQPDARAVAA